MKPETKKKLNDIVEKSFMFKNEVVKIKEWNEFASGRIVVLFHGGTSAAMLPSELQGFFDSLYPVDPKYVAPEKNEEKKQFPKSAALNMDVLKSAASPGKKENNLPATSSEATFDASVINPVSESDSIKNNLLEMMEKVKGDPRCLPQAKAMVEIANAIVGVQKNQIQMVQLLKKHNPKPSVS